MCWTRWGEKEEKKGVDVLRLFGLRDSWRKKKVAKAKRVAFILIFKASELHLLWFDVKSVKGRKEGKDEDSMRPLPSGPLFRCYPG